MALVGGRAATSGAPPRSDAGPSAWQNADWSARSFATSLNFATPGGEGKDAVELGARQHAAGRVRDLDDDVRVVVGVGDDDRHLARASPVAALLTNAARRVPQHVAQDLVEAAAGTGSSRPRRGRRAGTAADAPGFRGSSLPPARRRWPGRSRRRATSRGPQTTNRGLRCARSSAAKAVELTAAAPRARARRRRPSAAERLQGTALARGREAAGSVLLEQQPQRQPPREKSERKASTSSLAAGARVASRRRRARRAGAHGPARLAHLVGAPPNLAALRNVALGFRRHVAHSGGGVTSAIFAAEAPYHAMSSSAAAARVILELGHAREERRQHAVQVRARAAPVRDLARDCSRSRAACGPWPAPARRPKPF